MKVYMATQHHSAVFYIYFIRQILMNYQWINSSALTKQSQCQFCITI